MKSPLGKFRGFKLHKSDAKDKRDLLPSAQLDELAQAAQDMQDMRNCYDSLLSAAAATANSAYEFSESLREMGSCLLEKTALHDDEESGRILLMLGKVQFELQKLVDSYRSHIFLTITNPSESLLNELRTVEDMKRQCDEKRNVYEYMVAQQKEKGKSKSGKGESFTLQQLRTAHDEYNEEATLYVFRLKSLKQGQSRSLLTQAARHHAAQLNFFRKGLKSLEAVDQHVKIVTDQQHIDYQFRGLEDDEDKEDGEDDENGDDTSEERELSFDYRANKQGHDVVSASRNSMEVDDEDLSFPQALVTENGQSNQEKIQGGLQISLREPRLVSHSAPIFPERKSDPIERIRPMQSPARKSNTYVLPTPIDAKAATPSRSSSSVAHTRPTDLGGRTHNLWHSSPLEQKKHEKDSGESHLSDYTVLKARSQNESDSFKSSTQLPPPLLEGTSFPQLDTYNASDNKKIKRQSFSGPITSKPLSTKPALSSSGPISSNDPPQQVFGVVPRVTIPQTTSPKVSPTASPPLASSPRISELHELPRPPGNLASKPTKLLASIGHSAPLVRNSDHSGTNKIPSTATNYASPLPMPPLVVPRSFSIPSSSQRAMAVHVSKSVESLHVPDKAEEVDSPPLTPISLASKRASMISELVPHSGKIRGGS